MPGELPLHNPRGQGYRGTFPSVQTTRPSIYSWVECSTRSRFETTSAAGEHPEATPIRRTSVAEPKRCRRLVAPVVFLVAFLAAATGSPVVAEEGMWTFDNLPLQHLKERYGFVPTKEWLDHLRLASVRLNDGGSGSFVERGRPRA